jgi:hypothetical protein
MSKVVTKIEMLRKGGRGAAGTRANAEHHAKPMLPFVDSLEKPLQFLGFPLWRQGHNVHEFVTEDGRKFTLRGITRGKDEKDRPNYIGIRLSLRPSHRLEYRLFDIEDVSDVPVLLAMMASLAKPQIGRDTDLMNGCGSN